MKNATSDIVLERLMSLHPKIIDLTLDRVFRLLEALGNPHLQLAPVVHIAGTNGKGSTLAMIRAGLEAEGHRAQAYTSPHLARFHERIRLADGLISETDLSAVLEECESANAGAPITYFEITTVAAILAFSREEADFCLLEVGLGGRLDATNVIDHPRLTVITPVSLDHQQYLGETIEEIAFEKAGILKSESLCIVGPQDPRAMKVIKKRANDIGAQLSVSGADWQVTETAQGVNFIGETGVLDLQKPRLIGAHQVENAGTALAALQSLGIEQKGCVAAMEDAIWSARLEHLMQGQLVERAAGCELWLDGGHNAAAGQALAEALARLPEKPLHLICGMLNTKDVRSYLDALSVRAEGLVAVSIPGETATLSAEETRAAAISVGLSAKIAPSVEAAVDLIRDVAPDARILICGSLYLAGHVLRIN